MIKLFLKQIEAITEEKSNYISFLNNKIAQQDTFFKDLHLLKLIAKTIEIPEDVINFFAQENSQIFYEFSMKQQKSHTSFFNKLYRLEQKEQLESQQMNKYRNMLLDTYANALRCEPHVAFLLEIAYINLASSFVNGCLQNETSNRLKKELLFMKKVIDFIADIRKELSKRFTLPVQFIKSLVDQVPYACTALHPISDFEPLFLSVGYPLPLFLEIHSILLSYLSHQQVDDFCTSIKKVNLLTKEDLAKCGFSRFSLPPANELGVLLRTLTKQAERSEIELIKRDKELSLIDHRVSEQTKRAVKEKAHLITNIIDEKNRKPILEASYKISEALSDVEKMCLDYIWHLKDLMKKTYSLSQDIESNRSLQAMDKNHLEQVLKQHIYKDRDKISRLGIEFLKLNPLLSIARSKIEKTIIQKTALLFNRVEKGEVNNREKTRELLVNFSELGGTKFHPDVNKILSLYKKTGEQLLLPLLMNTLFQKNIRQWPLPTNAATVSQSRLQNETNYFGILAIPKGKFFHFSQKAQIRTKDSTVSKEIQDKLTKIVERKFKKVVTVLVYDIRGSSFMTLKLHNAEREQMIIKYFHTTMAKIAKEFGAFLLKDIGDGGIIWFGNNSKELYSSIYRESMTKKFKKLRHSLLSEEGLFLQSSHGSSEKAIQCAIAMVKAAEKFIKDNYVKYRDWFSGLQERELLVEGTTYALLPPLFRSLFRLGIGVSSGLPSTDIAIGPNAFGDPDLRGLLVNEAKFLSEGRDPENSVILADHDTVINLLLNASRFTLGSADFSVSDSDEMITKVAQIVKEKLEGGTLNFYTKHFIAHPYEILSLETFKTTKYTPLPLNLDDDGIFYNEKGEQIKIVYQIQFT